jgi:hypothetical protein
MKINMDKNKATLTFNCCKVRTAYVKKDLFVKLDDCAKKAVFIDNTATSQRYLFYDTGPIREFQARDVQFNEWCLYSELLGSGSQGSSSTVTFEIPDSTPSSEQYVNDTVPSCAATPPAATTSKTSESQDEASQQLRLEAATE